MKNLFERLRGPVAWGVAGFALGWFVTSIFIEAGLIGTKD